MQLGESPSSVFAAWFCWFLAWLTLRAEGRGDMFLRNVAPSPNYRALQPRRPCFSYTLTNPITVNRMSGNPYRNMKNEKFCSQLSTCFKRHMVFRKADELLVCSDKTSQFLQTCIITYKNKHNFWIFYRWINKLWRNSPFARQRLIKTRFRDNECAMTPESRNNPLLDNGS
jgi:hypothetical protein